jgi:hypothetical protein
VCEETVDDAYDIPLEVVVVGHSVVILGPDGASVAITAEAAAQSAKLLADAADQARKALSTRDEPPAMSAGR